MYLLALAPDFAEAADARGDTPLHAAAAAGAAAAAQVLLLAEAALDPLNGNELTPLHLAAEGGRKELVMMLLGAGASAGLTDLVSATAPRPLNLACLAIGACVISPFPPPLFSLSPLAACEYARY